MVEVRAAVPLPIEEGKNLVNEGHTLIPSKRVDVDKNARKSHCDYEPKVKWRLVSCGYFEGQSNLRTDAPTIPTSDGETRY